MNRIKELRKSRGLTQVELAKLLHISQGALSGHETGRFEPDSATLRAYADFFGVSVDEVIGHKPRTSSDDLLDSEGDLWEFREQLRRDPERRELFHKARYADIEEVRQAVAVLDALKKTKGGD